MLARKAIASDYPFVRELLLEMVAENGLANLDLAKAETQVITVFTEGIVLVVEDDGKVIATSGLMTGSFWYSTDRFLGDYWTYVGNSARQGRAFVHLMNAVRETARNMGLPLIIGPTSPVRTEAKLRLYRRFMPIVGGLFMEN